MKTENLKAVAAVNKISNAVSIKNIDELKNTGKAYGGFNFIVGDVITFPEEFCEECFAKTVFNNRDVPYIKVFVNETPIWVTVKSFARDMVDNWREVYKDHKINYDLKNVNDDSERVALLMQLHQIKVTATVQARSVAFHDNKIKYDENGQACTRLRTYSIFSKL